MFSIKKGRAIFLFTTLVFASLICWKIGLFSIQNLNKKDFLSATPNNKKVEKKLVTLNQEKKKIYVVAGKKEELTKSTTLGLEMLKDDTTYQQDEDYEMEIPEDSTIPQELLDLELVIRENKNNEQSNMESSDITPQELLDLEFFAKKQEELGFISSPDISAP